MRIGSGPGRLPPLEVLCGIAHHPVELSLGHVPGQHGAVSVAREVRGERGTHFAKSVRKAPPASRRREPSAVSSPPSLSRASVSRSTCSASFAPKRAHSSSSRCSCHEWQSVSTSTHITTAVCTDYAVHSRQREPAHTFFSFSCLEMRVAVLRTCASERGGLRGVGSLSATSLSPLCYTDPTVRPLVACLRLCRTAVLQASAVPRALGQPPMVARPPLAPSPTPRLPLPLLAAPRNQAHRLRASVRKAWQHPSREAWAPARLRAPRHPLRPPGAHPGPCLRKVHRTVKRQRVLKCERSYLRGTKAPGQRKQTASDTNMRGGDDGRRRSRRLMLLVARRTEATNTCTRLMLMPAREKRKRQLRESRQREGPSRGGRS